MVRLNRHSHLVIGSGMECDGCTELHACIFLTYRCCGQGDGVYVLVSSLIEFFPSVYFTLRVVKHPVVSSFGIDENACIPRLHKSHGQIPYLLVFVWLAVQSAVSKSTSVVVVHVYSHHVGSAVGIQQSHLFAGQLHVFSGGPVCSSGINQCPIDIIMTWAVVMSCSQEDLLTLEGFQGECAPDVYV